MSLEQLKKEFALLDQAGQAELISYALQLRYSQDARHRREVTARLNDLEESLWLTPEKLERRLDQN